MSKIPKPSQTLQDKTSRRERFKQVDLLLRCVRMQPRALMKTLVDNPIIPIVQSATSLPYAALKSLSPNGQIATREGSEIMKLGLAELDPGYEEHAWSYKEYPVDEVYYIILRQ